MSEKPILFSGDEKELNTYKFQRIRMFLLSVCVLVGLYFLMEYFGIPVLNALISALIVMVIFQFQYPFVQVFIDEVEIKVLKHFTFYKRVKTIPLLKCKKAEITIQEKDQVTLRYQLKGEIVKRIPITSLSSSQQEDIEALNKALKENMILQLNQENSSS